jgi:hypothetical protein
MLLQGHQAGINLVHFFFSGEEQEFKMMIEQNVINM